MESGDRRLLSSVCKEGTVKLWDVQSTRRIKLIDEVGIWIREVFLTIRDFLGRN